MAAKRFEVYLVNLDPTFGGEIEKTHPCAVISPDEMNRHTRTVIIAPMTTKSRAYLSRVSCRFEGKQALSSAAQIRTVDQQRLIKYLGPIEERAQRAVLGVLAELFASPRAKR